MRRSSVQLAAVEQPALLLSTSEARKRHFPSLLTQVYLIRSIIGITSMEKTPLQLNKRPVERGGAGSFTPG